MSKPVEFQTTALLDNKFDLYTVRGYPVEIPGYPYITAYKGYYNINTPIHRGTKKWYIVDANAHFIIGQGQRKIEDAMQSTIEYLKVHNCTELNYWEAIQSSLMVVLKGFAK